MEWQIYTLREILQENYLFLIDVAYNDILRLKTLLMRCLRVMFFVELELLQTKA